MGRLTAFVMCVVLGLLLFGRATSPAAARSPQALRTCVDRWNQANMRGWGPNLVDIAMRRLVPAEIHNVGSYGRARRCVVSIASNLHEQTFVCVINGGGAYECSRYSDGAPPLRRANGRLDARGVLRLEAPLVGTHPVGPLAWQHYPHVDGYIHPWTSGGKLRRGLSFYTSRGPRFRGRCFKGSEYTRDSAALKCVSDVQFEACYAPTRNWNRRGAVVACASAGSTRFTRFAISRRS
jgi:hypothetical protein